ncbi:histidine phosphatase family protein [Pseudooceanicola aestuarii]|uniref:histidine phosphatase family protein n=1 Tax=Pseudooceanicola aestuarii TaxID=2697319 RepID=UPI0013D3954B|nr:histidine phosphatase family protein [Pseudooceanicola aestuarii]
MADSGAGTGPGRRVAMQIQPAQPGAGAGPAYVAFLRHGAYRQRADAPSARQPFPLTEEGLAQARAGADRLAAMLAARGLVPAPVIHSSCQLRAWQTAEAVRLRLGAQVRTLRQTSALAERGLGSAANLTVAEIEAVLAADPRHPAPPPGWKSDRDYRLPLEGAESLAEAGARVAAHLQATLQSGRVVVHVGHGAAFRHACCHLGLLAPERIAALSMYHAEPLLFCYQPHGSWRHLAGQWKVRAPKEEPID